MDRFDIAAEASRVSAAGADALAHFASRDAIETAAASLERHEFGAWSDADQDKAARELRALADCYHPYHD